MADELNWQLRRTKGNSFKYSQLQPTAVTRRKADCVLAVAILVLEVAESFEHT